MSHKRAMMAKIHIAKKDLGLDEDTYRDVLWRVTGKRSCKGMDIKELNAVIADMQSSGWKPKPAAKYGKKPRVAKSRTITLDKIEAILADMSLPWGYAKGMARNMFNRDAIEWLNDEELRKLMQALAVYQKRQAKKQEQEREKAND